MREAEAACPFCGGATSPITTNTKPTPRVSRAMLIAGIGAAAVGAACNQTVATYYGAPFDASDIDAPSDAAGFDAIPFYGGPPLEAGVDAPSEAAPSDASADAPDGD